MPIKAELIYNACKQSVIMFLQLFFTYFTNQENVEFSTIFLQNTFNKNLLSGKDSYVVDYLFK